MNARHAAAPAAFPSHQALPATRARIQEMSMTRTTTLQNLRAAACRRGLALAAAAFAAGPLCAQTEAPAARQARPARQEIGAATRNILEIQRSGAQGGQLQPLQGEQAALSYPRYMATFSYPIPEFYTGQASSQRGGGMTAGGAGAAGR
ncbi:DUF3613 domain-containing protein [Cupriavidus sp. 30B13]|uniref:DUF3613 domain-containing protein n=1 Tax=Cupriavidus sp. 30B13 TaxID=3384241 RepID=UPI003B8F06AF